MNQSDSKLFDIVIQMLNTKKEIDQVINDIHKANDLLPHNEELK